MNLTELALGAVASVSHVAGAGSFRRRLLELGIVPGTRVQLIGIAPLGDPLELLVRGSSLSIRRADALSVQVAPIEDVEPRAVSAEVAANLAASGFRGAP